MRISESRLRSLIREEIMSVIISEVGPGVGMDPTGATMPRGMERSEYKQISTADLHVFLSYMSLIDPTMASDLADAALYVIEGDGKSAVLVLAFAGGGLLSGAAAVKLAKGLRKLGMAVSESKRIAKNTVKAASDLVDYASAAEPTVTVTVALERLAKSEGWTRPASVTRDLPPPQSAEEGTYGADIRDDPAGLSEELTRILTESSGGQVMVFLQRGKMNVADQDVIDIKDAPSQITLEDDVSEVTLSSDAEAHFFSVKYQLGRDIEGPGIVDVDVLRDELKRASEMPSPKVPEEPRQGLFDKRVKDVTAAAR